MADLHKLLVLEESVLISMAGNPAFTAEFPFLSGLHAKTSKGGCAPCQRKKQLATNVNNVKQAIVSLGPERKQKLKKLLNSEKVRVRLINGGKIVEYTF